jgi:hypothetical protein
LCGLGNELVLLGQMHERGRMKPIDFSQIFLSIGAVISDLSLAKIPSEREDVRS